MCEGSGGRYAVLEHTADLKLRACGDSFAATLSHLAEGLFAILFTAAPAGKTESRECIIDAWDYQSLVVNFLNELIYQIEEELIQPTGVSILAVKDDSLTFSLNWQKAQEPPAYEIKAATYHDLVVEDTIIEVVFDL